MSIMRWLSRQAITDANVRGEIFRLGGRHAGEPLEGARRELKTGGLPFHQAMLLRACIRKLQQPG